MTAFPYFGLTVITIVAAYVFETLLDLRQHARYKAKERPSALAAVVDQQTFDKSQALRISLLPPSPHSL